MDWQTVVNITYYLYKMEFSEEHNKLYGQVILTERKKRSSKNVHAVVPGLTASSPTFNPVKQLTRMLTLELTIQSR